MDSKSQLTIQAHISQSTNLCALRLRGVRIASIYILIMQWPFLGAITAAIGFSKDNPNVAIVFLIAPIFSAFLEYFF